MTALGWFNTFPGSPCPFLATGFGTFLLRQAFLQIPRDLHEAAALDGYGHLRFLGPGGRPAGPAGHRRARRSSPSSRPGTSTCGRSWSPGTDNLRTPSRSASSSCIGTQARPDQRRRWPGRSSPSFRSSSCCSSSRSSSSGASPPVRSSRRTPAVACVAACHWPSWGNAGMRPPHAAPAAALAAGSPPRGSWPRPCAVVAARVGDARAGSTAASSACTPYALTASSARDGQHHLLGVDGPGQRPDPPDAHRHVQHLAVARST